MFMKNIFLKSFGFIFLVGLLFSSCDLLKDLKYTVTPNPLEMHGDSVRISVVAKFPEKGIHKKAKAEIQPMLGNTELKPVTVLGEKATGNGSTVKYKPGGVVTYSDVVLYKPEYEVTDLIVTGKVFKGKKEKEKFPNTKIADGTIITPLLVKKEFKVITTSDNFKRVSEKQFTAQLNYDKADATVKASELKDKDIFEFQHWLAAAETNPKITIKSISIVGYASPEGEVGSNSNLSSDRASSARDAIKQLAAKSKNTIAQTEIYSISGSGEDWTGFKIELEKSTMNEDEKALIIRVLEMYQDPTQREIEMRNMAKTFDYLEKNVLPKLRRAEIKVIYDEIGKTDEEIIAISKTEPEKLDVEELLFAATLTQDLEEKFRIYNEACNIYPLDIRTHINAGAILFSQNKMEDAGFKFEAANSLQENPISKNNLGAIQAMLGNKVKAKQLFGEASGAGPEVSFNLAYYDIVENRYGKAISNYGSMDCFNKALAELLTGSYENVYKTLNNSTDKETALGYYLRALICSRQGNADGAAGHLKTSFNLDAEYKAKAMRDREFVKFAKVPSFMDVFK